MLQYICTVFDVEGNVLRVEPFGAATDQCARDQGILFQLTTRNGAAFEVWAGMRKVAAFYGKRSAWSTRPRRAPARVPAMKRARPRRHASQVH